MTRKFAALIIVALISSGLGGAAVEHYFDFQGLSSMGNGGILTTYQASNATSIVTNVQFVTSTKTVNVATAPSSIEVEGLVYSEIYIPSYVYLIHCLPVAYVACATYPAPITITKNFSQPIGNSTYSYYVGNYAVVVPNNQSYGVSVRLATHPGGSHLTALGVLPLYSGTPVTTNYNIDCFFPSSNHSLFSIDCASE